MDDGCISYSVCHSALPQLFLARAIAFNASYAKRADKVDQRAFTSEPFAIRPDSQTSESVV